MYMYICRNVRVCMNGCMHLCPMPLCIVYVRVCLVIILISISRYIYIYIIAIILPVIGLLFSSIMAHDINMILAHFIFTWYLYINFF